MTNVSVGRLVHYKLPEAAALQVNKRRLDGVMSGTAKVENGSQIHFGNGHTAGDVLPAVVVRVWENNLVNLQVFLDGNDTLWVTSAAEGENEGQWSWPPRV